MTMYEDSNTKTEYNIHVFLALHEFRHWLAPKIPIGQCSLRFCLTRHVFFLVYPLTCRIIYIYIYIPIMYVRM